MRLEPRLGRDLSGFCRPPGGWADRPAVAFVILLLVATARVRIPLRERNLIRSATPTRSLTAQCAKRSTNDRAPPFRPPPSTPTRASHPATCARRCGCCAIRWRASTTAPPTARSNDSSACSLPAPCCATSSFPTARGRRALGVRRSDHRPGALRLKLPRRLDAHHGPQLEPVRSTP